MTRFNLGLFMLATLFVGPVHASSDPLDAREMAARGLSHAEDFPGLTGLCNLEDPIRDAGKRRSGDNKKRFDRY
jgi:metallo-beta-lactamase class B